MSDEETLDTRSLKLAANYIDVVRELLKELYPNSIPREIQARYHMKKLPSGFIDIQFPEEL